MGTNLSLKKEQIEAEVKAVQAAFSFFDLNTLQYPSVLVTQQSAVTQNKNGHRHL